MISLACELAGVPLSNPILTASGTFGFGKPYAPLYPLDKLGGIVTKGLTLHPRAGNAGTRPSGRPSGIRAGRRHRRHFRGRGRAGIYNGRSRRRADRNL